MVSTSFGSASKENAPEQSFDVRIGSGGPYLEYVWKGLIPNYPFEDSEENRRKYSLYSAVFIIALPIIVLIATFFVDFIFIYIVLALAIIIAIFTEAAHLPYLLNKTIFRLDQGTLFVDTEPLVFRRSRSVSRHEIRYLEASYSGSRSYQGRGSPACWTSLYVERTDGSHIVLMKVEGNRADVYRLARALRNWLGIQEKKETARKEMVPIRSNPPERERTQVG